MKNKKSTIIKAFTALLLIAVVTAFTVALCACDDGSSKPQNPNSEKFTYSQAEHIGWAKSMSNFSDSAYSQYYSNGEPAFVIPGLNKGQNFVLQGIAYCEAQNWTLLCGYINPKTDKSNSVIFVMDMSQKATSTSGVQYSGVLIKEIFLQNADGTAFEGHAGGIAVTNKNVWIANGKKLHRIPISDIVSATESNEIKIASSIKVPVLSSYCNYFDGILWVGEFEYAKDNYKTEESHHNTQNSRLTAWTVGYILNEDGEEGYDEVSGFKISALGEVAVPDYVLWHGEKVQGMAEAGGKIALSTSYGRKNNSTLFVYDNPVRGAHIKSADGTVTISGNEVPYYIIDDNGESIIAPPMTEDLTVKKDGEQYKILVASESGAYYYHGHSALNKSKNPTDFVWIFSVAQ